jgi:hypothetical protein
MSMVKHCLGQQHEAHDHALENHDLKPFGLQRIEEASERNKEEQVFGLSAWNGRSTEL